MIWRPSSHKRIVQVADFISILFGFVISYVIWNQFIVNIKTTRYSPLVLNENHILILFLLSYLFVFILQENGAYSYQRFTSILKEISIILKSSVYAVMIAVFLSYMLGEKSIARSYFTISFILIVFILIIEKIVLFKIANFVRNSGRNRKRIIIIGTGSRARKFIETVQSNKSWGLDIIGILTGEIDNVGQEINGIQVIDHYSNFQSILKTINPEEIIITISTKRFDQIRDVLEICEREGVTVRLNSDFFGRITKNVTVDKVYGLNIISFNMVKQSEIDLFLKRFIDIVGSIVAIVIFFPFMIVAAVGIWITDGKPVLYNWKVIGINKKPFKSWKFRTMVKNADELKHRLEGKNEMDGPVFKIKDDPRIIPFGRWLRKWSIDETPQLFSVLKGDMSLVGPRPAGPNELVRYDSWHRRKLSIKPGITCLWQINGRNEISNFDEWVKLDLEYIDNWSLLLDIKILLKTIPSVILGRGAR